MSEEFRRADEEFKRRQSCFKCAVTLNELNKCQNRNICKSCRRAQALAWYWKNRESNLLKLKSYRESHKEYLRKSKHEWYMRNQQDQQKKGRIRGNRHNQNMRLNVLLHYGGNPPKCACCGEKEMAFLTIDHIFGGGKKFRATTLGRDQYRWIIRNNYPPTIQILCMNCNLAKGIYGRCPHSLKMNPLVK